MNWLEWIISGALAGWIAGRDLWRGRSALSGRLIPPTLSMSK